MTGYELSRDWFNFRFENPSKVRAVHTELYLYLVDQWNRLGQKKEIGLPTRFTMESLGIGSYNTFKNTLSDLIEWGFLKLIKDSHNQHSSKVIALLKNDKASDKALDEASIKATTKALDKPTDTIIEQENKGIIQNKGIEQRKENFAQSLKPFLEKYGKDLLNDFYLHWTESKPDAKKFRAEDEKYFDVGKRLGTWKKNESKFSGPQNLQKSQRPESVFEHQERKIQELKQRMNASNSQTNQPIDIGHSEV